MPRRGVLSIWPGLDIVGNAGNGFMITRETVYHTMNEFDGNRRLRFVRQCGFCAISKHQCARCFYEATSYIDGISKHEARDLSARRSENCRQRLFPPRQAGQGSSYVQRRRKDIPIVGKFPFASLFCPLQTMTSPCTMTVGDASLKVNTVPNDTVMQ